MRFLFLTQYFPPEIGAPQTRLAAVTRAVRAAGHEVEVVTALPNYPSGRVFRGYRGKVYAREEFEGIPVHRTWLVASMGAGMGRLANYASFALTCAIGLRRAHQPDFVFIESPPLSLAVPGLMAARLWRARSILNVADLWPDSVREMGVLREGAFLSAAERLEAWAYRRADLVSAVTDSIGHALMESKAVPPRKVVSLPNGVDLDLFRPRPRDPTVLDELGLKMSGGEFVVMYAGTLGLAQGLDTALDAMALLAVRGSLVHLLLVGDGSERARLERTAEERQLPNVTFAAPMPLETLARLWSVADAGFASLRKLKVFEGVRPSKIFPVMGAGKPLLYSGSGETARLIEDADAGLVAPPEDAAAMAAMFEQLAADRGLAVRLGENGRRYAEQHLSWERLVRDWLEQLRERTGLW
jgi:colanic acid biosynthesis glycosyl transferase WcaI